MAECLPEFEYFYCILGKKKLFRKLEDQALQTMQL